MNSFEEIGTSLARKFDHFFKIKSPFVLGNGAELLHFLVNTENMWILLEPLQPLIEWDLRNCFRSISLEGFKSWHWGNYSSYPNVLGRFLGTLWSVNPLNFRGLWHHKGWVTVTYFIVNFTSLMERKPSDLLLYTKAQSSFKSFSRMQVFPMQY